MNNTFTFISFTKSTHTCPKLYPELVTFANDSLHGRQHVFGLFHGGMMFYQMILLPRLDVGQTFATVRKVVPFHVHVAHPTNQRHGGSTAGSELLVRGANATVEYLE